MADLVRDHIGLRKVTRCLEAPRELVEEFRVEIDLLVGRTVERTHRRLGCTATRLVALGISDERGRRIATVQQFPPHVFGGREHLKHEMPGIGIEPALTGGRALLRSRSEPAASSATKPPQRAQQEVADHKDDDSAKAEPARDQRQEASKSTAAKAAAAKAALAGDIFKIAALALVAEPHWGLLLRLSNAPRSERLQSSA